MSVNVPEYPKNVAIGLYEGYCNLKCPKCVAFGDSRSDTLIRGAMDRENAYRLLDELEGKDTVVALGGCAEPLLQKDCVSYYKEMKDRGMQVHINTNGVLLTEELAQQLIDIEVDCVLVSIDATTKETLKKTRGIDDLDRIEQAVFSLLKARGNRLTTRLGVSFVAEPANESEKDEFISNWLQHVDVVRIAELFRKDDVFDRPDERGPCSFLFEYMVIHHNGDVPICCWECNGETNLGNVFEQDIKTVWHGEGFQQARHYHETGQFDRIPLCKNCTDWNRNYLKEEETSNGILIRKSPRMTFYNRIDRLSTWTFNEGKKVNLNAGNQTLG